MNLPSQQRGMGVTGMVLMISMAIVCLKLGMAIVPAHIGHYQLKKSVAWELKKANDNKESADNLYNNLSTQWGINGYQENPRDIITITNNTKGNISVQMNYEESNNLFGNVDIVSRFDDPITAEDARVATQ